MFEERIFEPTHAISSDADRSPVDFCTASLTGSLIERQSSEQNADLAVAQPEQVFGRHLGSGPIVDANKRRRISEVGFVDHHHWFPPS